MKKALTLLIALLLVAGSVTACSLPDDEESASAEPETVIESKTAGEQETTGKTENAAETNTPAETDNAAEFTTIGDLLIFNRAHFMQESYTDNSFIYVYELNGVYYRAVASLPEDVSAQLEELDILDEDYEAREYELISPLEILHIENLSEMIPPQEEMDLWVGKTGEELFDAGWTNAGWNLDEMVFWMNYGAFQYDVVMEGEVKSPDDFGDEDINSLVVKSVVYNGQLGDATEIGE